MNAPDPQRPDDSRAVLTGISDVAATMDWLASLRGLSVNKAVPPLLSRLEALARTEVAPRQRLELLHLFKRPVLKAAAALPAPDPRRPDTALPGEAGLTLEQRLDGAMRANLKRLFYEIDRHRFSSDAASEDDRQWALRNLFKFLRRQVRYALLARCDCPRATWQELHDLFVYLIIRGNVRVDDSVRVDFFEGGFDPQTEYVRMLLMGRAQQCDLTGAAILAMIGHLTDWAQHSRLIDPGSDNLTMGLLLVEVSQDRPVRYIAGGLDETFRGWVLEADRRFLVFCKQHPRDQGPLAADNPFRAYLQ